MFIRRHEVLKSTLGALVVLSVLLAAGCDHDDGGNPTLDAAQTLDGALDANTQMDSAVTPDSGPDAAVVADCNSLQEGLNENFMVDGTARSFILNLPDGADTGGPWPVIFSWHGLGDTAANFSFLLSTTVNGAYPFIGVTPEDTNFMLMGINAEWNVFQVPDPATNMEARLFDEVLACIEQRWGVDTNRVHSIGFSNGAFLADLLGVIRGGQIASLATWSGGYISNPDNVATLGALTSMVDWPAPTHGNPYAQLLIHGGTTDTYNMMVATLHFDVYATNDGTYLNGMGHDVVRCNHGTGHTAPADMPPARIMEFLEAHPKDVGTSPYASGIPATFPAHCEYLGAP